MAELIGTTGNDSIDGQSVADTISGLPGNDTLAGFDGQDLIYGNQTNDILYGNTGEDTLYGGQGNDTLFGGDDRDALYGNFGDDSLRGNDGNDRLYGGQDNDVLTGNDGNDLLYGNLGNDLLLGDGGNDTLYGGQGNDQLDGNLGNDILYGNFGDDFLHEFGVFGGSDTMYGGQGNDRLREDGGNTFFDGSKTVNQHDELWGNLGSDTFDFNHYDASDGPSGNHEANTDRIMDFVTGTDKFEATLHLNSGDTLNGPEYTEVQASGVTSVEEAINYANENALFKNGPIGSNDYVFIAGATHGYLIVNVDGDRGNFEPGSDYAVVLQNHNTLDSFGAGDIITHLD